MQTLKIKPYSLILFLLFGEVRALAQVTFYKNFSNGSTIFNSMVKTNDGGYVMCGAHTSSFAPFGSNILVVKTNSIGDTLWQRSFGGSNSDEGTCIVQTADGGFALTGYSESYSFTNTVFLSKIDAMGNLLWTQLFALKNTAYKISKLKQTSDNGFIITGTCENLNIDQDIYMLKTDSIGNIQWLKIYQTTYIERAYEVEVTSDGGYIIAGVSSTGVTFADDDALLIKTDSTGSIVWAKSYGGNQTDRVFSVIETQDGGYVSAGMTISFGTSNGAYLIKTDSIGNQQWSKIYYGIGNLSNNPITIKKTPDSGYVICSNAPTKSFLLKTDSMFNTSWLKSYSAGSQTNYNVSTDIELTDDRGYIFTGYNDTFGVLGVKANLIKTDSLGNSGCNNSLNTISDTSISSVENVISFTILPPSTSTSIAMTTYNIGLLVNTICQTVGFTNIQSSINNIQLFPNPATDYLSLTLPSREGTNPYKISICDVMGKEVYIASTTTLNVKLHTSNFSPGVYFVQVSGGSNYIAWARFIKE